MSWEELCLKIKKFGWMKVQPTKLEIDLHCNGTNYELFPFKYNAKLIHPDIPITIYDNGSIFCEIGDTDFYPILIQNNVEFTKIYQIIMLLSI